MQPKPDSKKYTDLIRETSNGYIKVPKFQRNFVWSIEKTAGLLDSILKGYPIGTLIMWDTHERLNDVKNIGNLKLPPAPEGTKVQYVLDGQQRITSLYAAFRGAKIQKDGEKKITDYSDIYVDLESSVENNDNQIVVSEKPVGEYITLNQVLNLNDNLLEIKEKYSDANFKKIYEYSQTFSTYDFSTIVLRREDIESAIEVFTRINTGGQTLTLFEIMSAKTYSEVQKFDMEEKFQDLLSDLSICKYDTISSSVILSLLALVISKNKECKRKVILQLDTQEIIDSWDSVISAIKESIDYFRSVYRIPVSTLLPYDSLIVPFAYFFYVQKDKPKGIQSKYLEEFFWRVSLSSRYSSSTESKLAQDIKRIDEIIDGKRPNYDDYKIYLSSYKDLIDTNFSAGSSYCKAILCLLAYHEPKDFQDNGRIILDNSWLKVANSKNYHHFFPKAYLRKNNIGNENSLVNITLVGAELNKRKISAKAPSIYIQGFLDENDQLPITLESHLIAGLDESGIMSDDYLVFLQRRAKFIYKELLDRIDLNHKEDNKEEELKELILNGESDALEFKATLRYDILTGQVNKKLEYVVAKTISAFMNTEGGTLIIGIDDTGNVKGLERDIETLSKQSIDGLELHLKQIISKYLGNNLEQYIKIGFPRVDDKQVCLISVSRSSTPIFVKYEGDENFFIRYGNSSIPKTRKEQSEYEKQHFIQL